MKGIARRLAGPLVLLLTLVCAGTGEARAQGGSPAERAMEVRGGDVHLDVSRAAAGRDPAATQDEGTTVEWFIRGYTARITIQLTDAPGDVRLVARAAYPTVGTAVGEVELYAGMPPTDLVVGIPPWTPGSAQVVFEVRPSVEDAPNADRGGDVYRVRYRIARQDDREASFVGDDGDGFFPNQ